MNQLKFKDMPYERPDLDEFRSLFVDFIDRLKNAADFDAAWEEASKEASEMALDLAESALMRNIQAGDTKAIKFYLQCKGKPRGYDLRQEIDLNATVTRPKVVFEDDEDAVQD